jgi:Mn2+/Fe2+ NRAMP family transporter
VSTKALQLSLGIVTSIGGFLEVGSIATSGQAGASFSYQLLWPIVLGTLVLIFLVEMSGRLAAVSKLTVSGAMRDRFGFDYFVVPLVTLSIVIYLVLAAEIGGAAFALQLVTGISFRWWAVPVALLSWLLLWRGPFSLVERWVPLVGLVTLVFLVGAVKLSPDWGAVAHGLIPTRPSHDKLHYWFLVVNILGATIAPYLMYFYSSGAVEGKWDESYLTINRFIAILGMSFGGVLAVAVLIGAAAVFNPAGIKVEGYDQLALMLTGVLGKWGFYLFAASLFIGCLGAILEISLAVAYMTSQGMGWRWGQDEEPRRVPRFVIVYTLLLALAPWLIVLGVSPLTVTSLSMALTAATLPVAILPFIVLMNDPVYAGKHTNGWIGNFVVVFTIVMACILAVVTIPLQLLGGG